MTNIYLIRHTQAEGNLYHMMQGHWDGDVTAVGRRQLDALAERFRGLPMDAVYSSDLHRAVLTAAAVTRYSGLPIQRDERLREINIGPWEAQFFANAAYAEPEPFRLFVEDPERYYKEGAETYRDVGDRAFPAFLEIADKNPGKTVAVVSHGITIRCLLSRAAHIPLNDTDRLPLCRNTGVSLLHYEDGRFTVEYLNDHSHLSTPGLNPPMKTASLRHEYIDPAEYEEYYKSCYEDAWRFAHGDLTGFDAEPYYQSALEHYRADPQSVCIMLDGERRAGLLDMDVEHGAHAGYGWISLLYLEPEYRRRGLAVQLLARAIVKYQGLGRTSLRLHVSEDNTAAAAFYERCGFRELSWERRRSGRLRLMEKSLGHNWDY